ncbi:putative tail protein [Morganella phage Mecenats66]|nr:putative tail protein [Morganella phage Mecenats66]
MRENIHVRSGNTIFVVFDGKRVGLIQNVTPTDDYAPDAASGIGDIHVKEYVPTMARHSLSVSSMVLKKESLLAAGIQPENGDAVLNGLVFDFEVFDKRDGKLLRKYIGCSYATGTTEISKHAIITTSATFNALDVTGVNV